MRRRSAFDAGIRVRLAGLWLRLLAAYPVGVVQLVLNRQVTGGGVEHEPALQRGDVLDDLFGYRVEPLHQRVPSAWVHASASVASSPPEWSAIWHRDLMLVTPGW